VSFNWKSYQCWKVSILALKFCKARNTPFTRHRQLALCIYFPVTVDSLFPETWLSVEDHHKGLCDFPFFFGVTFLWGWHREEVSRWRSRTIDGLVGQIGNTSAIVLLNFCGKVLKLCLLVCWFVKCWWLCWGLSVSDIVWASMWPEIVPKWSSVYYIQPFDIMPLLKQSVCKIENGWVKDMTRNRRVA
jgi:hypothetical protein